MCVCHLGGLFGLFKQLIHNRGVGQGADVTELRLSVVKKNEKKKMGKTKFKTVKATAGLARLLLSPNSACQIHV